MGTLIAGSADVVARALAEDLGDGDVTTAATVPADARARAVIRQKAPGVIYGLDVAEGVFRSLDPEATFARAVDEGVWREDGEVLSVEGHARALLSGERTALNFLQRLSGVATMAARRCGPSTARTRASWTPARPLRGCGRSRRPQWRPAGPPTTGPACMTRSSSRRTTPPWPAAWARPSAARARTLRTSRWRWSAATWPRWTRRSPRGRARLLLDNMSPAQLAAAVEHVAGRAELEASGGVTLQTLREVASTGVDFVSVGALTHSAPALDLSLLLTPLP